jgi:hypothetical protein
MQDCDQGDDACLGDCYDQGDAAAQQAYDDLAQCVNQSGCNDQQSCDRACGQEADACFGGGAGGPGGVPGGPGGGGQLGCGGVLDCLNACDPNDDACGQDCFDLGSDQAGQLLDALGQCLDDSQCMSQRACQQACGDEIDACFNDQ